MIEQRKILRIFKLISLLKGIKKRSPIEISKILNISKRTVYRYLNLLEDLGFMIDVDLNNNYFIHTDVGNEFEFTFNSEESILIRESLISISINNNLTQNILKKLYMMSEQGQIGKNILNADNGLKIEKLSNSIKNKLQVKLVNYSSLNSNSNSNRIFEPIAFTSNYTGVIGIDVNNAPSDTRIFNINRIGNVEILDRLQKFSSNVTVNPIDSFGYKGNVLYDIILTLNRKAYSYLIQFYPETKSIIKGKKDSYKFSGKVYFSENLFRFLVSFPDAVKINSPEILKKELLNFKILLNK